MGFLTCMGFLVRRANSQHSCGGETWERMEVDFRSQERNTSKCFSEPKLCLLSPGPLSVLDSHKAPKKAGEINRNLLTCGSLFDLNR